MLGRPGMGLKLNTFYRRKHERDAGHLDIRKGPLQKLCLGQCAVYARDARLAMCPHNDTLQAAHLCMTDLVNSL